jgi:hypothetical protein
MFLVFTITAAAAAAATSTYSTTTTTTTSTSTTTVIAGIIDEDEKCYSFSVKISPNVYAI